MSNEILKFAEDGTATDLLTNAEYLADAQRLIGNQAGVARRKLVNKAARQSAFMSKVLADYLIQQVGGDVLDDDDDVTLLAKMTSVFSTQVQNTSYILSNVGLTATANTPANSLTLAVKTAGGTDPSATSPLKVGFGNGTITTGQYSILSLTAALSLVITSGSTLGTLANISSTIYVYFINSAGVIKLGVSRVALDETQIHTSVAEGGAGGADSATTLYSDAAYSNVRVRLFSKVVIAQATPGTWVTAPTQVSLMPFTPSKIYAYYDTTSSQTVTSGGGFIAENRINDELAFYNTSTGVGIIPKTGWWTFKVMLNVNGVVGAVSNTLGVILGKTGSETRSWLGPHFIFQTTSSITSYITLDVTYYFVKGDNFQVTFSENVTNAMALTNSANRNYLEIFEA